MKKKEYNMKRLLITSGLLAAGGAFAENATPAALTIESKVEFGTASVGSERYTMGKNIVPSVKVGIPILDGSGELYFFGEGTFKVESGDNHGGTDVLFGIGLSYDLTSLFTLDIGYDWDHDLEKDTKISRVNGKRFVVTQNGAVGYHNVYDRNGIRRRVAIDSVDGKRSFHELYLGAKVDVPLDPTLYVKYDITQRRTKVEGAIGHTFGLGSSGFAIRVGAKLGYVNIKKPNGVNAKVIFDGDNRIVDLYDKKDWYYVGANADLAYNFNEHAKVYAGVAAIWNSAPKDSWVNSAYGKNHKVWFTVGSEFSF
jgi:opacity protein-like surface antigen